MKAGCVSASQEMSLGDIVPEYQLTVDRTKM